MLGKEAYKYTGYKAVKRLEISRVRAIHILENSLRNLGWKENFDSLRRMGLGNWEPVVFLLRKKKKSSGFYFFNYFIFKL